MASKFQTTGQSGVITALIRPPPIKHSAASIRKKPSKSDTYRFDWIFFVNPKGTSLHVTRKENDSERINKPLNWLLSPQLELN